MRAPKANTAAALTSGLLTYCRFSSMSVTPIFMATAATCKPQARFVISIEQLRGLHISGKGQSHRLSDRRPLPPPCSTLSYCCKECLRHVQAPGFGCWGGFQCFYAGCMS